MLWNYKFWKWKRLYYYLSIIRDYSYDTAKCIILKLLFYLHPYTQCHKSGSPPPIAWRHFWMFPSHCGYNQKLFRAGHFSPFFYCVPKISFKKFHKSCDPSIHQDSKTLLLSNMSCSGDLNTVLVWCSNGLKLSDG